MYCRLLVFIFALLAPSLAVEQRKPHRTIENRLRIVNPDPNDAEPLRIEASGGGKKKTKPDKDEKPKTLSQQIVDGKYGLIQKELFAKPPKRPGILSYENNPEVPNDNLDNLGGLDKNEIWLAENHLLVLRGGQFPPYDDKKINAEAPWPPLDSYKAPLHQVKIPKHPKVPPPFPVQLTENGPLQILGTNSSRTLNETDKAYAYPVPPPEGYDPSSFYAFDTNSSDASPWSAPMQVPFNPSGEYAPGEPFPPHLLNGSLPPSLGFLPPGAVVLPPPGNLTDELYDYDDPSIYYPPPYSFFYPKDNSSAVPAGPLVPGIVLPPPPNFFAALEETTTAGPVTTVRKPVRQRKPTTTTPLPTTTKPTEGTTRKAVRIYPTSNYYSNEIKPTVTTTTTAPRPSTVLPTRPDNRYLPVVTRKPTVTKLRPINPPKTYPNKPFLQYGPPAPSRSPYAPTTQVPLEYNTTPNDIKPYGPPTPSRSPYEPTTQVPLEYHTTANDIKQYNPPAPSRTPFVTTTQVPLKYHTTSNDIETNSVTQESDRYAGTRRGKSTKPRPTPTQYFYYEETEKAAPPTTRRPARPIYLDSTEEYYRRPKPVPTTTMTRQRKPQYVYVTARPYNTQKPRFRFIQQPVNSNTFDVHIAKLQKQIQQQYYTAPKTTYRPAPKPVYQFSFQAENYPARQNGFKPSPQELPQQDEFRPGYSVEIQQAIEVTPTYDNRRPTYDNRRPTYDNRRPIYDNRRPIFYQQEYRQSTEPPRNEYTTPRPEYDFETVTQKAKYVATPRPISQYSFEVTQNPVFRGFYTQPDEGYFDDRTKKYFTMFGRKLPSTTPIPALDQVTPIDSYSYRQKPVSLEGDTLVNYVNPRPTINPDAEIIPVPNPPPPRYPNVVKYPSRPEEDAPNPEIIKAIPIDVESGKSEDGSFISYQLPGDDGAHFYFLTPQLAQSRDQGAGFYYSRPQRSRIRRNEKTIDKER